MHTRQLKLALFAAIIFSVFALAPQQPALGCSRVVYLGAGGMVITGRTMDWMTDLGSNLWAFPRGMKRNGAAGLHSIHWTSKYGSVIVSAFGAGTVDGMNDHGLVANLLYLAESQYPKASEQDKRPTLCVSAWAQYVLDNYATVAEAVKALRQAPFRMVAVQTPDGHPGNVHLAISDSSGDSAIFEYLGGKLRIHHGRQYQVMTNSPIYDQQLALNAYWKQIGGLTMLPGTNRAADRFVRASFYIHAIPKTDDSAQAVASVFSVLCNVSVPLGITTPGQPNISSTLWRSVADQKNKRYYFESTRSPDTFWVDLSALDLSAGSPARKLQLTGGKVYSGDAAKQFQPAPPFKFLDAKVN